MVSVGLSDLEEYRGVVRGRVSSGSQHSYLTSVRHFFRWAFESGLIAENPAARLQVPRRRRGLPSGLSHEEVCEVLEGIDVSSWLGVRDRAALELMYSSGLRRSEVLGLDIEDVGDGVVVVRCGKGGRDRVCPVGERAMCWLRQYLSERPFSSSAVFVSCRGGRLSARQLSKLAARYTGGRGACHVLRHSVASELCRRGADVRQIQELLGHEDIRSTQIYTKVAVRDVRRMHEKFHPFR